MAASATSRRLWLGTSVARPTAMPLAPLSSTNGRRAGSSSGLGRRAVVVGHEVDGAFVDLVEQQARDRVQARLGVAHRRRAVAVAAAEVALAVDQRIAQAEVLRHAHERVVGGAVAVRMELAQHVADDRGALARLRARAARVGERQAHAVHRVQDAALHRLAAVGDVGQRAALDDAQRVFEIGALGVVGEGQRVAAAVAAAEREGSLFHGQTGFPLIAERAPREGGPRGALSVLAGTRPAATRAVSSGTYRAGRRETLTSSRHGVAQRPQTAGAQDTTSTPCACCGSLRCSSAQ